MWPVASLILATIFLIYDIENVHSTLIIGIVFSIIPTAFGEKWIKAAGMILFFILFLLFVFEQRRELDRAFINGKNSAYINSNTGLTRRCS